MKLLKFLSPLLLSTMFMFADDQIVVTSHADLPEYVLGGIAVKGISTPNSGAQQFEVWQASIASGSGIMLHANETEEVVVITQGSGKAILSSGQIVDFDGPCTIVFPANAQHQVINTGIDQIEGFAVLGIGSNIYSQIGTVMMLPWRQ